ncbi:Tad domain-containing protein, partial [bacterium]|nr:Tad domain-containing protein [bacterium]
MRKKNRGQIVIMVALFMLVLVILFSLVADVGKVYLWQKKLEMAVDAAALAGGQEYALRFTSSDTQTQTQAQNQARAVAIYYAGLNGADTNNVTVTFLDELNDTVPVGGGEQAYITPSTLEEVVAFLGLYPELAYAGGKDGKG